LIHQLQQLLWRFCLEYIRNPYAFNLRAFLFVSLAFICGTEALLLPLYASFHFFLFFSFLLSTSIFEFHSVSLCHSQRYPYAACPHCDVLVPDWLHVVVPARPDWCLHRRHQDVPQTETE
jgi:hypothetical protein